MNISKFGKDFKSPFIGKMDIPKENDGDESDKLSYKGEDDKHFTRLGRMSSYDIKKKKFWNFKNNYRSNCK